MPLAINRFYFLRHGQTNANRDQIFHADESIAITDLGHEQASKAAAVLNTLPISRIVSSPYHRVQQTLAPYLSLQPQLQHDQDEDLAERSFAGLDGQKFEDVVGEPASSESWIRFWDQTHAGVEPTADFYTRVQRGMTSNLTHNNMLLAAHGGVLVAIINALNLPLDGSSHGNAHPILFEKDATTGAWHAANWQWEQERFERWC